MPRGFSRSGLLLTCAALGIQDSAPPGHGVTMIETHICSDGSLGITDLIGFKQIDTRG
jgi:hypothetical protein